MENKLEIEIKGEIDNKLINDKLDLIENTLSNLDLNNDQQILDKFELDYSKILYYSLVFDDDNYNKILSIVFTNTNIFGIYKYKSSDQIEIIKEKPNDKNYDFKKDFSNIICKLNPNDIFAIGYNDSNIKNGKQNKILYKLNEKFHTTMLYLGGKKDIKALDFEPIIGKDIFAKIISVGISDKFIVCKIELVDKSIPYYGNPIQHITIGLKKTESNKFKLFPKDSPTAFDEGIIINLDDPLEIFGKLVKETKK
jgi:hypothetical protein